MKMASILLLAVVSLAAASCGRDDGGGDASGNVQFLVSATARSSRPTAK
jgi:hypothetical protein